MTVQDIDEVDGEGLKVGGGGGAAVGESVDLRQDGADLALQAGDDGGNVRDALALLDDGCGGGDGGEGAEGEEGGDDGEEEHVELGELAGD